MLLQPYPFDFLLEKTEGAATTRPPLVVFRQAEPGPFQDIEDASLVDSGFLERQPDDELVMLRGIPFAVFFVTADGDVAVNYHAVVEHRAKPAFERAKDRKSTRLNSIH